MTDAEQPLTEREVRVLVRKLWGGIESASDLLASRVQPPIEVSPDPFDVDKAAAELMKLNLLAVGDHARTVAAVIDRSDLGPSAATLARGSLESLARIYWIARGADMDSVRGRVLRVLHGDVSTSAHSSRFSAPGRILTRDEYLAEIKARLDALKVEKPKWSVSAAIREVVAEAWGNTPPWGLDGGFNEWTPYSQLSAAAHGTLPALGSFVNRETGKLGLPCQEAINAIGIVYGVADRTFRALDRGPVPFLAEGTVTDVWGPIASSLEVHRQRLAAEDGADLASHPWRR